LTSKTHFSNATILLGATGIIALSACTELDGPGSGNLFEGSAPAAAPAPTPVVAAPVATDPAPAPFVRKTRVNPLEASDDDN